MAEKIGRVPVREQDPKVRARNFEEVCYGYNEQEALLESSRCLHCDYFGFGNFRGGRETKW